MAKTVRGIYRNGHVELLEEPEGLEQTEVLVSFPDVEPAVKDDRVRKARRQGALKWLRETGWHLGHPYPSRDELHERTR